MVISVKSERIRYLDIYKGIGIILVVLGHTEMIPEGLKLWLEAFHMPLFFVAAGVLIGDLKLYERDGMSVVKDRMRSILVPYFWFSLIAILWDGVGIFLDPAQYTIEGMTAKIWDSVSLYGVSVLWFFPAFFIGTAAYQFLRKRLYYSVSAILLAILAAVICGINGIPDYIAGKDMTVEVFLLQAAYALWRGCVGMFFCAVGEGMSILIRHYKEKKLPLVLTGAALIGVGTYAAFKNFELSGTMASFRFLITGEMALFFLAAICLSGGILILCWWINQCSPLEYLGKYSLIIMVTHLDLRVMNIAKKTGDKIFELLDHNFARNITVFIVILGLEVIMIWLFNGILGFMVGKRRKKMTHPNA